MIRVREPWMTCRKMSAALGMALLLVVANAAVVRAEINLIFGTYTADKPTTTVKKYKPFLNYLEQEMATALGQPVSIRMKIANEYEAGINQLVNGEVDFARFGPASYVTAVSREAGIQIVAMESKKGKKRFKGIIAVHSDNEIATLAELRQHSFAFGSELSTIGRYLAQSHLLRAGITRDDLSHYEYLGRHDRVGTAVGRGQYTAGALKQSTFKKLVAKGVPIRALFEFDNVTKPWIAAADLDPEIIRVMRDVMLNLEDEDVLNSVNKDGFLAGTDTDYELIRKAMQHSAAF